MNFVFSQMAAAYQEWQHSRERNCLIASEDTIFKNAYRDIERILKELGKSHGTRFEFECYDVGHLYTLAHFANLGLVGAAVLHSDESSASKGGSG